MHFYFLKENWDLRKTKGMFVILSISEMSLIIIAELSTFLLFVISTLSCIKRNKPSEIKWQQYCKMPVAKPGKTNDFSNKLGLFPWVTLNSTAVHNLLENKNYLSLPLLSTLSSDVRHLKSLWRLFHLFLSYFKQRVCRHCFFVRVRSLFLPRNMTF